MDSAMLVPTIRARAGADSSPPYRWASSVRPTSHTFSLSTSVPSMSNSTAWSGSRYAMISQPIRRPDPPSRRLPQRPASHRVW